MLLSALPCCGADSVGLGEIRIPAAATVTLGTTGGSNTAAGDQAQTDPTAPQEPSDGIDQRLIGEWGYDDISLYGIEYHNYFFYENGTSSLFITGSTRYHGEARYSTSNGKIFLTEYYYIDGKGEKNFRMDKVVEYSIGTDERGEYLTIGNIPGYTEYGENRPNMKFRRM